MAKVEKQQWIQQALVAMLDKKSISQNEFARMVDVSPANISHIVNGRLERTMSEEIWNKVAVPFGEMDELRLVKTTAYARTVAECERAARTHSLICVLGEPGYGKTSALRHHFLTTPQVYFVEFRYSMGRREFFADVARAMGLETSPRTTLNGLIQQCADKLNAVTGSLLIVDEVSTVQPEKLHYLRELRERTKANAGMLLAGAPYFGTKLTRWVTRGLDGVPEFESRISHIEPLPAPTKSEIRFICKGNGVTDAATLRAIESQAKDLRRVRNMLRNIEQGGTYTAND